MTQSNAQLDVQVGQGLALHRLGRVSEAEQIYRQVLAAQPDHADALQLLAVIVQNAGQVAEAEALFRRSLRANAKQPIVWYNLGRLLFASGRFQETLDACDRAIKLRSNYAAAFANRSAALLGLARNDEALESSGRAVALDPANIQAHSNQAAALTALKRPGEALTSVKKALALAPENLDSIYNRACALMGLKRFDEAIADFGKVLAQSPDHARANYNEAIARLTLGDMPRAWTQYEWRWQNEPLIGKKPAFSHPEWNGEDVAGKTVLIYGEQGMGDTLQFIRYLPLVAERAAHVIATVPPALKPLLCGQFPKVEILSPDDPLPPFDVQCALLSLPRVFQTELQTIPGLKPYVLAPAEALSRWEAKLGPKSTKRVGLVWAGNPSHANDRLRSIPLKRFAPLLECDVELFSLQKDLRSGDKPWLEKKGVKNFGGEIRDFTDTAALVGLMDVVISVDTSVAHLAGAMGKPTWILLPNIDVDWRWMLDREDSPWYPSARLFRQTAPDDWDSVISRIVSALPKAAT
jgi:tetratricopeptide (TPR) repeat protein